MAITPRILNRRNSSRKYGLSSEINITPFVDVMLVLLIVFMVTSPMLVSGVDVNLPSHSASPVSGQDEPLAVTVDKKGVVYLQESAVSVSDLAVKIKAIIGEKNDIRIFIRGDCDATYGKIVEVFHNLRSAGIQNVVLVSTVSTNNSKNKNSNNSKQHK